MMQWIVRLALVVVACTAVVPDAVATPRVRYERAIQREEGVRADLAAPRPKPETIREARRIIGAFEQVRRLYPRSGYSDNALWQAGMLAADIWAVTGDAADHARAVRLLNAVAREYPSSSLAARARSESERLERLGAGAAPARAARADTPRAGPARTAPSRAQPAPPDAPPARDTPEPPAHAVQHEDEDDAPAFRVPEPTPVAMREITAEPPPARTDGEPANVRSIVRTAMGSFVRVTIELDREVSYHHERIGNPDRVFVDLSPARLSLGGDKSQRFASGAVRQIRTGEQPNQTARVVLDVEGVSRHSVFALYDPFRLIIDCEVGDGPTSAVAGTAAPRPSRPVPVEPGPGAPAHVLTAAAAAARASAAAAAEPDIRAAAATSGSTLPSRTSTTAAPPSATAPAGPPSANLRGRFSLSRQLGLGISRIVIDPGHGGHDPGAIGNGVTEAELVLDIALRLEQLLLKQPGVEVVLTRRTNVFVPLEERTAIANREDADLFLSVHANASRNRQARGIETYFLNFASNPQAEAVAARENAASGQTMRNLPDIVRAIATNNKLDESRDFATMVQRAMVERLRGANKEVRDLGVKQAPFVVLIGAGMPSVLAEVSFVTHQQEARLLKGSAYRQRIAEALFEGVQRYQRSLKNSRTVATQ